MKRKGFIVREELKAFWEDEKVLSTEAFAALGKGILFKAFNSLKAGEKEEEVMRLTMESFTILLSNYAMGERKVYWQEFKRLFDEGVIKKQSFIEYVIKTQGYTHEQAVQYVAETFGMKESTQAVYLSDEFTLRQKEKARRQRRPEQ